MTDSYTREYDYNKAVDLIRNVAKRFGCRLFVTHVPFNAVVSLPNGATLVDFDNLQDAKKWAEKWKK